jgi:hypothetical protein
MFSLNIFCFPHIYINLNRNRHLKSIQNIYNGCNIHSHVTHIHLFTRNVLTVGTEFGCYFIYLSFHLNLGYISPTTSFPKTIKYFSCSILLRIWQKPLATVTVIYFSWNEVKCVPFLGLGLRQDCNTRWNKLESDSQNLKAKERLNWNKWS